MSALSLSLLGQFRAWLDDQPIPRFKTRKVQALLIYLTAEPEKHLRESLMDLMWPGMPDRSARHNLRQVLYYLRNAIPDLHSKQDGDDDKVPLLLTNRQMIHLNPDASVKVDVAQFEALLNEVQAHEHINVLTCPACRTNLEKAIDIYQGDFLVDFYLDDSNVFEEWAQVTREAYRRKVLDALEVLTAADTRQGEYPKAQALARRQLEIDNLRESAYRQLMEILALSGHREEALTVYENCRRLLAEELSMEPSNRTTEIAEKIMAGDLSFDMPLAQGVRGYELKEEIGAGAYGAIHRAYQSTIDREVAVKVIHRRFANDPEFIRRFEAEAQTVARLEHPHIVPLYDYWRDPDGAYLVMRYLKGGNLLSALESGPWDVGPAARMLDQIAAALSAAHRQGIVHRDIKPANILLDKSGNAYLSDFGIAKDLTGDIRLTAVGAVTGTLDYISPDQILSHSVTPQTDIYSLGAVLYETLTGEKPFPDSTVANLIYKHLNDPVPLVTTSRPNMPSQVDAIIQRATAKRSADRYADALEMAAAFRQAAVNEISPISITVPETPPAAVEVYNPYKGLRAFQEVDADDFFGREALVQQLIDRLTNSRFLALVGPSGSGKSSAVKAGLIPALREGAIPGSEKWFVAEMVPGSHPLEELEMALWPIAVDPPPSLVEPMERDNRGLLRTIRRILPDEAPHRGGSQLLLIVDQFEELFTQVDDEEQRSFFIDSLLQAIAAPRSPLRVILTLRADFYDRPLGYETLGRLLKENTEVILPLTSEELTWTMREPARRVGVGLEEGLAEAIVADITDQPGALPLLEYALTELFERRQGRLLTREAYHQMGGTVGALAKRSSDIYNEFDEAGRETVHQMFLRLVTLGEGTEDTRRRVGRHELQAIASDPELMDEIIDTYAAYRLLSLDNDPVTRLPTVEVAHEAILREWGRLREWLNESRADIRLQRQLARAANDWQDADRDPSYLLRGSRLEQFESWWLITELALTQGERDYLTASLQLHDQEKAAEAEREAHELILEERSRSRLRAMVGIFAVAALVAIILTIIALNQRGAALDNEALAVAGQATATVAQGEAVAQSALAATRAAEAQEQRALAEEQRALAEEQRILAEEQRTVAEEQRTVAEEQEAVAVEQRAIAESNLAQAESQRLAALANNLLLLDRSPEVAALLALRGLDEQYTQEADIALQRAASSDFAQQLFKPDMGPLADVGFSPDGRYLLVAAAPENDETVSLQLWDVQAGDLLWEIPDYTLALLFWPSINNNMFPALEDAVVVTQLTDEGRTWIGLLDLKTGMPTRHFEGVSAPLTSYDVSPDGQTVAAATEEGIIHLWDVFSGEEIQRLTLDINEPGYILVQYSPDNRTLATRMGGTTLVWDPVTGQERHRLIDEPGFNFPMEFSADSRLLMTYKTPQLHIWDLESGEEISLQVPQTGGIPDAEITLSPDGRTLALPYNQKDILLWDLETDSEIRHLAGHLSTIWDLRFSPDGRTLLSGSTDTTARLWDVLTGEQARLLTGHTATVGAGRFSPDGRSAVTVGVANDQTIRIWTIAPLHEEEGLLSRASNFLQFSPDGKIALTKNPDNGLLQLLDPSSGQPLATIEQSRPILGTSSVFHFSGDGQEIVTVDDEGAIVQYDTQSGQLVSTFSNPNGKYSEYVSYIPGSQAIFATGDGGAYLIDAQSGELLRTMPADIDLGVNFAGFMAVSPDGRLGAAIMSSRTGAGSEPIYIWDLQSGAEVQVISQAFGTEALDFSHDGRTFAWGGNTNVAHVIDLQSGQEIYAFPHTQSVLGLAFSSDDRLLLTGAFDGTANLYDLKTGDLVRTFEGEAGGIGLFVDFTPDGGSVLLNLISTDRVIRSPVSIDSLIESTCDRVLRDLSEDEQRIFNLDDGPTCPKSEG